MTNPQGDRIGRTQQCRTTANKPLTNLIKTQPPSVKSNLIPPLSPYLLDHIKVQDRLNLKARGLTA